VILATAHPAKFPETIASVTGQYPKHPSLELLKDRPIIKQVLEANVEAVKEKIKLVNSEQNSEQCIVASRDMERG
jgi:threonine synthase